MRVRTENVGPISGSAGVFPAHIIFLAWTQPAGDPRFRPGESHPSNDPEAMMPLKSPMDRSDWKAFFRKIPTWVFLLLLILLFGRFILIVLVHFLFG
jgi:hypothetical protein